MKNPILFVALLLIPLLVPAQDENPDNGQTKLLYSEGTMKQLHHIVDSLNLKFRSCELSRTYYSLPQAKGHFVYIDSVDLKAVEKLLKTQPNIQTFAAAYPNAEIDKDLLLMKALTEDYDDKECVEFFSVEVGRQFSERIWIYGHPEIMNQKMQGKWVFRRKEADEYNAASLTAFYFETEFESKPLDDRYARMVQYVDCLVDTTTKTYLDNAEYGYPESSDIPVDSMTMKQKQEELKKLRGTLVMGQCSRDESPIRHARKIAILAAESVSWEVFLRAHLDIMNDRFERVADASEAIRRRYTYVHELELLDINTMELILGISFRISNPSENHYYGSIGRLGRAIAEAENVEAIEKQILGMIRDPALDDFNRIIMHNLFLSYIYQDTNEARQKTNTVRFREACKSLPEYLAKHVMVEEIDSRR
jgi:hypothetical protein